MFKRSLQNLAPRPDSPATRKKQKLDGPADSVRQQGKELLQAVEGLADSRSRAIATAFLKLPSKKLYPDYYEMITKPIALDVIRQNLNDGEYVTLDLMREDLLQMTNNAKRYNHKGSQLYSDASHIARIVKQWSGDAEVFSEDSEPDMVTPEMNAKTVRNMLNSSIKDILQQLRDAEDRTGRSIGEDFLELPDKKLYPGYYSTVARPLSINLLATKMRKNPYAKLSKFESDLSEMYENAFSFNEKNSKVAQDARALKKVSDKLIAELQPIIEQQEKELSQRAAMPTPKPQLPPSTPGTITTGGFKIKLGLRQSSATPPSTKVKLNLHSQSSNQRPTSTLNRVASSQLETPTANRPLNNPPTRKMSPAPSPQTPTSDQRFATIPANPNGPTLPAIATVAAPLRTSSPLVPTIATLPPPSPAPQVEVVPQYKNSGPPLITALSLAAPLVQPPMVVHLAAAAGRPSILYNWTLPNAGTSLTISPTLCSTLLNGRPYAMTFTVNGRKTASSRNGPNAVTSIIVGGPAARSQGNQIWDVKLSVGMNCIECIVEAGPSPTAPVLSNTSTNTPAANAAAAAAATSATTPTNASLPGSVPAKDSLLGSMANGTTTSATSVSTESKVNGTNGVGPEHAAFKPGLASHVTLEAAKERFAVLVFVR